MANTLVARFTRISLLAISAFFVFNSAAYAAVSYSQSVTLAPGWNIVSTPRILDSHAFSAPETLSNFAIYTLDPSGPSGWATMADLGQSEFTPLYGYFINNKTGVSQTLTFNYKASTTPNERLFERTFATTGWYAIGVANPAYAKVQGEGTADENNPSDILNSILAKIDLAVDFTGAVAWFDPDSVSLENEWEAKIPGDIDALHDLRELKGYAVHVSEGNALYIGLQNDNIPACQDGTDNDIDLLTDYPADTGCFSESDNDESPVFAGPGNLLIEKAADSPAGNVAANGSSVTIAKYVFTAQHERLKVENLRVLLETSDPNVTTLRNAALFADGVQIGSTQTLSTSTTYNLGSSLVIDPADSPVAVEVRADIFDTDGVNDISHGDLLHIAIEAPSVYRMQTLGYTSVGTVDADTVTVIEPQLSLAKYSAYANQIATVPQSAYKIGEWRLQAGESEGVNLDNITIALGGTASATDLTNLYVVYGSKTSTMKSVGASSQSWSVNESLAASATMEVRAYADLGSGVASGSTIIPTLTISGTGQSSGSAVTSPSVEGQTITAGEGVLSSSLDPSTPVSALVVANSMPKLASFKYTAQNDAFTIVDVGVTVGSANAAAAISEIVFKDGATELKRVPMNGTAATGTALNVAVPYNQSKVIDVYAQLGGIGTGFATTSSNVGVSLVSTKYRNSNGVELYENTVRAGNAMYALKTKPTIANVTLPATVLTNGTMSIAKVQITADAGGTVAWRKITFSVATTSVTATNFRIYDAANESTILTGSSAVAAADGNGRVTFTLTSDQEISTSKTYVVKADITGADATGDSISTSIPALGSLPTAPNTYAVIAGAAGSFIWSDESVIGHSDTTPDWTNDFLVKNLPTDSQTLTK